MSTLALSESILGRPVVTRAEARLAIGISGFTLLTALGGFVRVPLPFTPVPITLQTLFVLSAGVAIGRGPGALSQGIYLACGILGAPFFAGGGSGFTHLFGPTGGYLLAFPIAAWTVGSLRRGDARHGVAGTAFALLVGVAIIYTGGVTWLRLWGDLSISAALALGVLPFLPGTLLKVGLATVGLTAVRNRLDVLFPGRR